MTATKVVGCIFSPVNLLCVSFFGIYTPVRHWSLIWQKSWVDFWYGVLIVICPSLILDQFFTPLLHSVVCIAIAGTVLTHAYTHTHTRVHTRHRHLHHIHYLRLALVILLDLGWDWRIFLLSKLTVLFLFSVGLFFSWNEFSLGYHMQRLYWLSFSKFICSSCQYVSFFLSLLLTFFHGRNIYICLW